MIYRLLYWNWVGIGVDRLRFSDELADFPFNSSMVWCAMFIQHCAISSDLISWTALCSSSHDINILRRWSVFSASFIALRTLFLAGPNINASQGYNFAVVLDGIGTIVILFLLHNSCVASDLLIDAASKNKAAGALSVCLRMTWVLESCCHP